MERTVYLLGAGFSAPLGLPVMSNFYIKSKDMYYDNFDDYVHFNEVLKTINHMHSIKSYYESDLLNIEEILSILEMNKTLQPVEEKQFKGSFLKYICDVIQYYTPKLGKPNFKFSNWENNIFGSHKWNCYGHFVSTLFNLKLESFMAEEAGRGKKTIVQASMDSSANNQYHVITLNYDMVLENICNYVNENLRPPENIKFITDTASYPTLDIGAPTLSKLHGSADTGIIVAPTWNKNVDATIIDAWKEAYITLINANHLRIIGYSLPTADSYVKYLLKAAVIYAPHLKSIEVICKDDSDGSVRRRYDEFIKFTYYKFMNADVLDYLEEVKHNSSGKRTSANNVSEVSFVDKLEIAHKKFVSRFA